MHEVLVKNEEFKDSPLGNIPKDWELIKIGYSTNIENGTTPSREEDTALPGVMRYNSNN
ncbi:MAG TPA: hypothetical protein VE944_03405 [Nostoc sp.]|uniref:hypothetical protein n=1 Tax=Nostoc sp. TaxID=1180 RepID=UPI002D5E6C13|nr:hypothetical protein [Nostoc sp.]HYX13410.1 hypothetical protein [Nostoc sp.]